MLIAYKYLAPSGAFAMACWNILHFPAGDSQPACQV